jgi:hypothetical protein
MSTFGRGNARSGPFIECLLMRNFSHLPTARAFLNNDINMPDQSFTTTNY